MNNKIRLGLEERLMQVFLRAFLELLTRPLHVKYRCK